MPVELYIFSFFTVAYGALVTLAITGFNNLKRNYSYTSGELPFISIVISARNEEKTITKCLHGIINQKFPKDLYELILVDDCSEDDTVHVAQSILQQSGINYSLLRQDFHRGKKQSLASGIEKSRGTIIVTSDADVTYRHANWLNVIASYFKMHMPDMLVMPVDFENKPGILVSFQVVENLALTGFTSGFCGIKKPFLCNGANLAFRKQAFTEAGGYEPHQHISSGEDVFLMEAIKRIRPSGIHYVLLRELIVKTPAMQTLNTLLSQRIRWASKSKNNPNHLNVFAGFVIMGANLIWVALGVALLKSSTLIPYLSIFAVTKFIFDFLLLFLAADFLGRVKYVWWIFPFECVYWIYTLIVGIGSLIYKPYWKGKKTQ
ncbi:MAG: glycosyltransferase [Bacteroidota bacterium]|nr:glycosyltransferase [Bacteroidota bacterium]